MIIFLPSIGCGCGLRFLRYGTLVKHKMQLFRPLIVVICCTYSRSSSGTFVLYVLFRLFFSCVRITFDHNLLLAMHRLRFLWVHCAPDKELLKEFRISLDVITFWSPSVLLQEQDRIYVHAPVSVLNVPTVVSMTIMFIIYRASSLRWLKP